MDQLEALIAHAGSLGKAATLLGVPKSTLSSWQQKSAVPPWRVSQIETALRTFERFDDLNEGRASGNARA